MKTTSKAKLSAYISAPLSVLTGYLLAVLIFLFILKEPAPVPIFIMFAIIQVSAMTLYGVLPGRGKTIARMTSMFFIGLMLLILAGLLSQFNFQLEGFWFYLLTGVFSGTIVHFLMAKIVGPIFFSRNWCSWGCWTTMVLDLLPYKTNIKWGSAGAQRVRSYHFLLSLGLVALVVFGLGYSVIYTGPDIMTRETGTNAEMLWFLFGNIFYYVAGIVLAVVMKDNRAFCKYLCPITVFLRFTNRFTLLRIKGSDACTNCGTCTRNCPMGINIPAYIQAKTRVKSTECIMCMKCVATCPEAVLRTSLGLDLAQKELLV